MFLEFTTDVCAEALLYALCQALKLLLMGKQIVELHNDIHDGSGAQYRQTLMALPVVLVRLLMHFKGFQMHYTKLYYGHTRHSEQWSSATCSGCGVHTDT